MNPELEKIRDLLFSPDVANRNLGVQLIHSLKYGDSPFYKDIKRCIEVLCKDAKLPSVHTLVKEILANGISIKYNKDFVFLKAFEVLEPIVQIVNIQGCQLTTVPEIVTKFKQLKKLSLFNNALTILSSRIYELPLLEELDILKNNLQLIPPSIKQLKNLKKLFVSSYKYIGLPKELTQMPNLEHITWGVESRVEHTTIAIPSVLWDCVQLKSICLLGEDIITISKDIAKLKNLTKLVLLRLAITQLPAAVEQLIQLETISLTHLPHLKQLPNFIFKLPFLKEIIIYDVALEDISDLIYECPRLEYIYIKNTHINKEKIQILEENLLKCYPNCKIEVN